jgi:dTDP-4-dehydrorhamnose 3,5-epimerase
MSEPQVEDALLRAAAQDSQTVTPEGVRLDEVIAGVRVRRATTHSDDRGTLCEMYDPRWDFAEEPLVYVYQLTVRPGKAKGWVVHLEQDDRLFFSAGTAKVVLYDAREDSPTHGLVNELYFDAHNRGLLRIPKGVFHAVANVGDDDVLAVNMPTRPYRHDVPDKHRLSLDTDAIPYRF